MEKKEKKDFTMDEVAAGMVPEVAQDQEVEEVEEVVEQEQEKLPTGLHVERATYTSNGKKYFNYVVKGLIKGKPMQAELAPPDPGSYPLLDMMYSGCTSVELYRAPFEFKDDKGKKISGEKYGVLAVDEELGEISVTLKPKRDSDKNILQILMRLAARAAQGE